MLLETETQHENYLVQIIMMFQAGNFFHFQGALSLILCENKVCQEKLAILLNKEIFK